MPAALGDELHPNNWLYSVRQVLGGEPPSTLVVTPVHADVDADGSHGTVNVVQVLGGRTGVEKKADAALWRPANGKPVLSAAQGDLGPPQVFTIDVPRRMAIVAYPGGSEVAKGSRITDAGVSSPATTLARASGVLVVSLPGEPVVLSYREGGVEKKLTIKG